MRVYIYIYTIPVGNPIGKYRETSWTTGHRFYHQFGLYGIIIINKKKKNDKNKLPERSHEICILLENKRPTVLSYQDDRILYTGYSCVYITM